MKIKYRFLVVLSVVFFSAFFLSSVSADAATYYLAPTGNDNNACTQTAPCFTLQKAWTLIAAGDTVYLRGGTYSYSKQQGLIGKNGTATNLIKVWAYPGEIPVITRTATGYMTDIYWHRSGIFFTGNYVHFKGLEITGFKNISGNVEDGLLAYDANNNIFEQLNIHHNYHGMYIENNSSNNLILNCDFHDNYTDNNGGGDSDGLGISYNTGANNTVQGSRAWNNGDDGFDTFEAKGLVTFKNSWAWHNGYVYGTTTPAGNGVGFKLGSNFLQGTTLQNTVVRVVQNTIAADNRDSGYHINEGDHRTQLYNNVSYANSNTGLNFHWHTLVHTFKNNVSFGNTNRQVEVSSNSISTNNSYGSGYSDGGSGWAQTASAADFVSLDITQLDNPRGSDGSLPIITAFHLAPTSDLINAGTNVGLPYTGSAPDIGAFESGGTTPPGDTTAPTVSITVPINGVTVSGTINQTAIASDNIGVTKVDFYNGTTLLGTDTTSPYNYLWDTTTVSNGSKSLTAKAYDAAGNNTTSATVTIVVSNTATPPPDTIAPTVPTNLNGTPTSNSVSLTWTASTDAVGVTGYRIFRSTTSAGTYIQIGTAITTSYTDTGLTASTTYYYKVSAYDAAGNNSAQTAAKSVATTAATTTAGTYYLSPTGNDNNVCTITAPCFTLERAWQLIQPGNTVYLRGGTYAYNDMQYLQSRNGTAGNLIKIWAYPGETPNITRSSSYSIVNGVDQDLIYLEGNYFHFKGLEISYFEQKPNETGYPAFRAGFTSGSIFENINYHHNMSGFQIRGNSTGNLILNSDFHHNKDPYGPDPYDGADGLGITFNYDPNSVNTIRGSRAYWNADDGFDTWENSGHVIIENSWAFYNGYLPDTFSAAGNGTAFKLGSIATPSTQTKRTLKNNLAYKNRFAGFVENNAGVKMEMYNNTSVNAGYTGYWFGAWSGNGNVTIAKNNLDYLGANPPGPWNSASTVMNNSWQNNITVTNADFTSMDESQLLRARNSDGSLPTITFLTLATGSDLINAGTNVGLPYTGSAPDIGAFESGGTTPTPDITAPTAAITVPINGVTVSGTINLTATATDNVGVTKVDFYNGSTMIGTDTTSPYNLLWNTTTIANGTQILSAKSYDAVGNVGTSANVSVVVSNSTTNTPPVANAGTDKTITLPTNSVTLTGSGTDTDGTISSYTWLKISGPTVTMTNPSASVLISDMTVGSYVFRLTVTDNGGLTASDDVMVTMNPQPTTGIFSIGQRVQVYGGSATIRITPIGTVLGSQPVNALGTVVGGPITANNYIRWQVDYDNSPDGWTAETMIRSYSTSSGDTTAPTIPTNLNGTASSTSQINLTWTASTDAVGVTGYRVYRSNTSTGTYTQIGTSTTTSYSNTGLTANTTYYYKVSAYDLVGNSSAQTTAKSVVTLAVANQVPVANAGVDQTITLPTSSVTLTGSGTDVGGTIVSYAWTKISGPTAGTIVSPSSTTTVVSGLTQGVYTFWITVTDNQGATDADAVIVTVNGSTVTNLVNVASAINDAGYAHRVSQSFGIPADIASSPSRSTLRVFENNTELIPHGDHGQIENIGLGRFSHWMDEFGYEAVYISSTDNSNPKTNGRTYTYRTDGTPGGTTNSGFSDNFNRSDSSSFGVNWTERLPGTADFQIVSNQAKLTANYADVATVSTTNGIISANYKVESKIKFETGDGIFAGVVGRRANRNASDSNGYMAFAEPSAQSVTLYKRVAGVWTLLGTYQTTITSGTSYTIGLSMSGSTIQALWNGTAVITKTDTKFTASGSTGIIIGTGFENTIGVTWDDFRVTPL